MLSVSVCVGASSLSQYPVGLLYLLGGWRGSEIMERWSADGPGSTWLRSEGHADAGRRPSGETVAAWEPGGDESKRAAAAALNRHVSVTESPRGGDACSEWTSDLKYCRSWQTARLLRRGGVFSEIRLRVLYRTRAKEKPIKNLNSAFNCSYIFFFFF